MLWAGRSRLEQAGAGRSRPEQAGAGRSRPEQAGAPHREMCRAPEPTLAHGAGSHTTAPFSILVRSLDDLEFSLVT